MKQSSQPILARIIPFIGMGIFLVVAIIALVLFSYVLLIGALVGLVLFAIAYIKNRFFPNKDNPIQKSQQNQGHIYEHRKDR